MVFAFLSALASGVVAPLLDPATWAIAYLASRPGFAPQPVTAWCGALLIGALATTFGPFGWRVVYLPVQLGLLLSGLGPVSLMLLICEQRALQRAELWLRARRAS
ncbi:hypothetical protein [Phenylobacterium sp.]|uniref:hypothetical protein n=1 Tax=Phenylobacterium sp. TaxID=1871053 RepID=UPI0035B01DEE